MMIRLVLCLSLCACVCVAVGFGGQGTASVWGECRRRQRARLSCGRGDVTTDDIITNTTAAPVTPTTTFTTPTVPPTTTTTPPPKPTVKPIPDHDEVPDEHVTPFEDAANQIIKNDRKAAELCLKHGDVKVKEMYLSEGYRLKYYIPDLVRESIAVGVRHRALKVTAERLMSERGFSDVELLPEIVDPAQAQWSFDTGVLTILVPYKVTFNKEVEKTCTMNISEKDIAIDEFTEEIDVRFSNSALLAMVFPKEDA